MRLVLGIFIVAVQAASAVSAADPSGPVSFQQEVLPLLEQHCNRCHHPDESQGGLDLTRMSTIRRGGDQHGTSLVPGKPNESPLIRVLTGDIEPAMPLESEALPQEQIERLTRWVKEGAIDDSPQFSTDDLAFFEREVRPIFFAHCFKCHAGSDPASSLSLTSRFAILRGGDRGPSVVVGRPEQSRLMDAVRHNGELRMPLRGDHLSDKQIRSLEQWIRRGLPWPSEQLVLTREKQFTISNADRDHWAFRPLPTSLAKDWSIDALLDRIQNNARITRSPPADRYRLLRRATFDLIGYPPTPDEIAGFVNDDSADAFTKVVDRLLDSQHFGWRWGRHWLDYTRNGVNGQPNRGPDLDSERYAAWVAQCLNEDRPYDWFVKVHLAGDKMPAYQSSSNETSSDKHSPFVGPTESNDTTETPNTDGAKSPIVSYSVDQALAAAVPLNGLRTFQEAGTQTFVLMDKLDEGVEFMGRSLMGISLECARCHDHKFDPISQRDYYALLGFFQSSWYAPVPISTETQSEAVAAVKSYRQLAAERARLSGFIRRESTKLNIGGGGRTKKWRESRVPILGARDHRLLELESDVIRGELSEAETGNNGQRIKDLRELLARCQARLRDHIPPEFDLSTFKQIGYFIAGHKSQQGLISRATAVGLEATASELQKQAIFWQQERERWLERSRYGGFARDDPEVAELVHAADRIRELDRQLNGNPSQPWVSIGTDHLMVRTDGGLRRAEDLADLDADASAAGLQFNKNDPNRVLMHPYYIGDARQLDRGDVLYPLELVPRDVPQFFRSFDSPHSRNGIASFGSQRRQDSSGRLPLAQWLTRPNTVQSSLVARAAVNRVWQHLFGEGLCRTPKELGRLGEVPDIPDLIDGLAFRFIAEQWSIKKLVREIMLSRTYQQSSLPTGISLQRDPDNRFFARQNMRRLEAEPIVNMLSWFDHNKRIESSEQRNEILSKYSVWLPHFDGPTHDEIIERRNASIMATQALFLMNDLGSINSIVNAITNRLQSQEKVDLIKILDPLYQLVLQRPPTSEDRAFANSFLSDRRSRFGNSDPSAEIQQFVHLLLCGNELIHIE